MGNTNKGRAKGLADETSIIQNLNLIYNKYFTIVQMENKSKADIAGIDAVVVNKLTANTFPVQIKTAQGEFAESYLTITVRNRYGESTNAVKKFSKIPSILAYKGSPELYMPNCGYISSLIDMKIMSGQVFQGSHEDDYGNIVKDKSQLVRIYLSEIKNYSKTLSTKRTILWN